MATIYQSIEILSKEKGIDPQIVLEAVKDAMLVAARKHYRSDEELVAELDESTGAIAIFVVKNVVAEVQEPHLEMTLAEARRHDPSAEVGGQIRIRLKTDALGRISAQTAKQVILQKVREAERETVYEEYFDRVGELVNCTVKRFEGPDLMVDIGRTEARLPKREQSRAENFMVGDRIRCVIRSVEKAGKNAGVIVSRGAAELVMRLFEQEVPEIYDGTVVIQACAREAGERTKIAVSSRDRDVDSVGACVGMKGMRVQSIIRELRGEKIDIIQFSEDPVVFATNALSPAKISRVAIVDPEGRHMEVIVDDTQLSLAIGKKGQNVRLAARLLGWRIDIKSEEEKRQEVESEMAALVVPGAPVSVLVDHGLGDKMMEKLTEASVSTVEQLGQMTPEQLEEIPGIGPKMVEKIQSAVVSYYGQFEAALSTEGDAASEFPVGEAEETEVAEQAASDFAVPPVEGEGLPEGAPEGTSMTSEGMEPETAEDDTAQIEVADPEIAGPGETDSEPAGEESTGEVAEEKLSDTIDNSSDPTRED